MGVSMKDVKELRSRTGAGVLDCKKALTEKDGDLEKAVEYLRQKGMAEADKRSDRTAAEGKVNVLIDEDQEQGVIVEVNSETDFVAKNDNFKELVDNLSQQILESNADSVEQILEEEYQDTGKDVETAIKEAIASIGEKIKLRRFKRFNTTGFLRGYVHMGGKIGVMVELEGEKTEDNLKIAKDIAMHIAASSPKYLSRDNVSEEDVEKEKSIYKEQMLNEGKPEHIIDQIVEGKMDKYFTQVCLLEQEFVRDQDKTVGELLKEYDLKVNDFARFEVGEGIEVEEEDFASEVQAEIEKN